MLLHSIYTSLCPFTAILMHLRTVRKCALWANENPPRRVLNLAMHVISHARMTQRAPLDLILFKLIGPALGGFGRAERGRATKTIPGHHKRHILALQHPDIVKALHAVRMIRRRRLHAGNIADNGTILMTKWFHKRRIHWLKTKDKPL